MGEGNKKLSKRNPESNLFLHRDRGFIPEGLLNYLALLGWSISADRDIFSLDELCENFEIENVNPNPARFDQKKADAINSAHIRLLTDEDFMGRILPYLQSAGVIQGEPTAKQLEILSAVAPLTKERVIVLGDVPAMIEFLFVDVANLKIDEDALKQLPDNAVEIVAAATASLESLEDFTTDAIHQALSDALVEGLGEKPRNAFGPVRTAISGRRVTPPLFECMEILGKEQSLARLEAFAQSR
jgi:glutamyl-tRNA synthetase